MKGQRDVFPNRTGVQRRAAVTAIVLTKNEEMAIRECLESLAFCEQVIVVDSASTDATVSMAVEAGAEVVDFVWNGAYPKKKQWALDLDRIKHDWVLFVDADERPSVELANEIYAFLNSSQGVTAAAADVRMEYYFLGRRLDHGHRVCKRALVRRSRCRFPVIDDLAVANMWEVEGHYQPEVDGKVHALASLMRHSDPDPLYDYFARHNRYSDWEAHLILNPVLRRAVRSTRSRQGQLFDRLPAKPLLFFFYAYFIKAGWRDGRSGFHYAVALSFYYWQSSIKAKDLVRSHWVAGAPIEG